MNVVIVGGGPAGCFASLLLARAGHQVLIVERDLLTPHMDVEDAAAAAFRPVAPQIVQPHVVAARCRELLLQRLPDVHADLLGAGVVEAPLHTQMPATLPDRSSRPGDERFTSLLTRRSTVDWVLYRAVRAEPGVTLRTGVTVTGLLAEPAAHRGAPPRVTGVRTDAGAFAADVVVDATGRRSALRLWLRDLLPLGARETMTRHAACGLAYYSRHYRLRPGAELPGSPLRRMVVALDEFIAGIWPADNRVMQLAIAPLAADHRFRPVRDPDVFTAVLRTVPAYDAWLEVLDPITGVFVMGGLDNTLRRLVVDGVPVATGLHAIGDSVCTTNPTLGRGLALAMTGAAGLADILDKHPQDPTAQALAADDLVTAYIASFYTDQAAFDRAQLARLRHHVFGDPAPERAQATDGRVSFAEVRAAAPFDPVVYRAIWKVLGMIATPEDVYTDPEVVARTHQILRTPDTAPTIPVAQPTREQLVAALATQHPTRR